jgi:hypothetical protein
MATKTPIARTTPSTKAAIKRWKDARKVASQYLRGREDGATYQVFDFRTGEVLATAPAGDQVAEMDARLKATAELAERSGAERYWVRLPWGAIVQVSC